MPGRDGIRFAFVDALRCVAAALVLFQHIAEMPGGVPAWMKGLIYLGPGVAGVVLFFLVSGYVIPFSVRNGLDPVSFFIRRIFRIYPLFLAAIAIVAVGGATGLLSHWSFINAAPATAWLANLLLVQDFAGARPFLGVSWTLAIELIWYGAFACALLIWGKRAGAAISVIAAGGILLLAMISLVIDARIPLGRPAMIYAAALGYQVYRFQAGELNARELSVHVILFFGVTWISNLVAFGYFAHPHITLAQALGPWTIAPMIFLLVVLVRPVREARLLGRGAIPRLGAVSYSIYLLHPIAVAAAVEYLAPPLQLAGALLLTLLLSFAGYYWIERPGIALGRHLVLTTRQDRLKLERV